ncbi:MAG: EamA family transporter [Alcanivoracaceae bacterium]|nr:EamA family transporter [Alcanivoracaceae bacterium]
MSQNIHVQDIMIALLVVFLWGISFVIIKLGLDQLPPFLFSALRFALAAIPAVLFVRFPKKHWKAVVGIGFFIGVFKFSFLFLALDGHLSSGLASLLLQTQVYFTIFLSILLFRESITIIQMVGALISLVGFVILLCLNSQSYTMTGVLLILMAGLSWGVSNMIMKSIQGVNLFRLMVWSCVIPPIPLLIISYFIETDQPMYQLAQLNLMGWLSVLFLAYFSTLLAYALWGNLIRKYTASTITPIALLIPVIGLIASNLILNEKLLSHELVSVSIILIGLIVGVFGGYINNVASTHLINEKKGDT